VRRPVNIVLLALDATRPDHLSCYGYRHPTSPNLDRLAAEGARFEDVQAAQIPTHPAFTTLFTGLDPLYHGILAHSGERQLSHRIPMLAERLQAAGYVTAGIDNMMAMRAAPSWFARGFHYFRVYSYRPGSGEAARLTDWALGFLEEPGDTEAPLFLFVHYFDPHTPYLPPEPFRRRFYWGDERDPAQTSLREVLRPDDPLTPLLLQGLPLEEITDLEYVIAQYDGEIAFVDQEIGRLLAEIDRRGWRERTLVIVLSDHGEAFGEGGLYFDHHTLQEAVTRCVLLMRLPGVIPAGFVSGALVSSLDIAPTILELVGAPGIEPAELAGRSLLPLFGGTRVIREEAPIGEASRQVSRGVVTPEWRYIEPITVDAEGRPVPDLWGRPRAPAPALYHRPTDREGRRNVAAEHPEVARALAERVAARLQRAAAYTGTADPFRHCRPSLPYERMLERFRSRAGG
jgi:arylsulfatase A-like enzyme